MISFYYDNAKFIDFATKFMFVLLAGCFIGFFYALIGGTPICEFHYSGHPRTWYLFLTTQTSGVMPFPGVTVIRPTGIYDESGALSFFVCALAFIRALANKNEKETFLLLLFGNITFSMVHFMCFCIYLMYLLVKNIKKKSMILYAILTVFISLLTYYQFKEIFDNALLARFEYNEATGKLHGDNRSEQLEISIKLLDFDSFLWGKDELIYQDVGKFNQKYGYVLESPLGPLVLNGILVSFVFYLFFGSIFLAGLVCPKKSFIFVGIAMLFLQRPYFENTGYSLYFVLFLVKSFEIVKRKLFVKTTNNLINCNYKKGFFQLKDV
jgi:hypothetical protein